MLYVKLTYFHGTIFKISTWQIRGLVYLAMEQDSNCITNYGTANRFRTAITCLLGKSISEVS